MIPQNRSYDINRRPTLQFFVLTLALFSIVCLYPSGIFAQNLPQSDPFDVEIPLEFSEVRKALDRDDYDQALKLLSNLRIKSVKEKNKVLQEEVISTMKQVNQQKREFAKVRQSYETLKKKSIDPKAYKQVGDFYCAVKADWKKGLLLLSKSGNPALRQTVLADLKRPTIPAQQAQLADAWWKLAAQEKGNVRKAYQLRGRYWYLQARPRLPIKERVGREKKLQQIIIEADKIVIWNQHNGSYSDRGTTECIVTLLYKGKSVWRQKAQIPWEPDTPADRVLRPPHVRFDQVRIDVTKIRGKGGGLGEVEVFDGNINVARNSSTIANGYWEKNPSFHPNNLTNGNKTGQSGFWLLDNDQKGWALVDMINFLQQP
ncbi:hypothetical protein [Gimesia aquarii]|uniref:Uncharacterized protein n=1 Tax=Gimesia aquarii TaxID=2527964 RepID=A0A517W0Z0_9PLAN|nr:hypothetical protein [Gimesia aquarii]QDT98923.1 hypothetical protein V144x_44330 [Gimesia aquarii]